MPANFSAKVLFRLFLVAMVASSVTTWTPDCAVAQEESEQDELFAFPPQSPERLVRGAILADKLDRPQLAQKYLQTILDNQPSPETLRRLRREIGLSVFLKLSATPRLQPQSQKVLALVNAASPYETLSQAAIENLVQSLGQSPAITTDASLKLLAAEEGAVTALLNADPATRSGKIAHELLSRYPNRFQSGLQHALADAPPETQVRILNHLARTGDKDLAIEILPLQFSSNSQVAAAARSSLRNLDADQWVSLGAPEAASELLKHSAESLQRANHLAEINRTVIGTQADTKENSQTPDVNSSDRQASSQLQHALKLTSDAATLDDSLQTNAMQLSVEAAMNAWPAQWPDTTASADHVDSAILSQALHISHQTKNTAGLLSLLNTQNVNEVLKTDSRMSRELLLYQDPRVRLLTAASLWKTSNAPSAVESVLHDIADGGRKPEAVVIDPRYPEGSKATGILREIGYDVTFARSGSEGFTAAAEQLHCELVLIHSNSIRWPLSITLANLRADFRTQNVPIIIIGPSEHAQSVVRIVAADDLIWFEAEPLNKEVLERSLQLKKVPGAILSESERVAMQQLARDLMRQE